MKKTTYSLITLIVLLLMQAGCNTTPAPAELKGISLNKQSVEIDKGSTFQLFVIYEPEEAEETAGPVIWESSRKNVATVTPTGRVEAENVGSATITAQCGKFYAECKVTVVKGNPSNPQNPENPENPETPDPTYTLTLNKNSIDAPAAGGTYNIEVTSNTSWTASADADWVTMDVTEGNGNGDMKVTISPATENKITSATITFAYGSSGKVSLNITRAARDAMPITLDNDKKNIALHGEKFTINVTSELPWKATCTDDFVTLSNTTETSIDVIVADNSGGKIQYSDSERRNTSIQFSNGESTATFYISQEVPYVYLNEYWGAQDLPVNGGTYSAKLYSNISWSLSFTGDYSWVHLSPLSGNGNTTLSLTVDKNTTGKYRECRVHLYSGDYGYGIFQAGK